MTAKSKRLFFVSAAILALFLNAILVAAHFGYRINTTDSVPLGIYRLTLDPTASYVSFCPTLSQARIANERNYRPRSVACPDGFAPLMKPVTARAGDVITVTVNGVVVNGTLLPNTKAKAMDGLGRPLPSFPLGTYAVQPGTAWVVSTYNPSSFDSRYFGPISLWRIKSYAQPIWTF